MNTHETGIARRNFLRITGAAGVALGFKLQHCLAEASGADSTAATARTTIMPSGEIIVGLDIGTSKVRAVVGERQPDETIKIPGIGLASSLGVLSGEVVDSEAASRVCVRHWWMRR
jgi:hypothetical protein